MEPPAVNVGLGFQRNNSNLEKNRMLRIDSQLAYASTSHVFEELPENFLESISPQQNAYCSLEIASGHHLQNDLNGARLSPELSDQRFTNENVDILPHLSEQTSISSGLLTTVDELGDTHRSTYIKEESPDVYNNAGGCEAIYLPSSFERSVVNDDENEDDDADEEDNDIDEEDNLCNLHRHSPISLQNDPVLNAGEPYLFVRQPGTSNKQSNSKALSSVFDIKAEVLPTKTEETSTANCSTLLDPLNNELDDNLYIDTKLLCIQIANELKGHSIPQAVFAEKILCRSQGTLSDLLRNPKPWDKLKSGRETFRRMFNWMQQPIQLRLAILEMKGENDLAPLANNSPPMPAKSTRVRQSSVSDDGLQTKRPRLVFTNMQKQTLQAIFKETQRPSREMQTTIAEHLGLDLSTVSNFFMNARRRWRNGSSCTDELYVNEQASLSPSSPTKTTTIIRSNNGGGVNGGGHRRHNHSSTSSAGSFNHINETVDAVIANFATKPEAGTSVTTHTSDRTRSSRRIKHRIQIKSKGESPSSQHRGEHL